MMVSIKNRFDENAENQEKGGSGDVLFNLGVRPWRPAFDMRGATPRLLAIKVSMARRAAIHLQVECMHM